MKAITEFEAYLLKELNTIKELLHNKNIKTTICNEKYKQAEEILYNYKKLEKLVKQEANEIIESMQQESEIGFRKSKDIVKFTNNINNNTNIDVQEERVKNRLDSFKRTECDVRAISKILDIMKKEPNYRILEMWYLEGKGI